MNLKIAGEFILFIIGLLLSTYILIYRIEVKKTARNTGIEVPQTLVNLLDLNIFLALVSVIFILIAFATSAFIF